MKELTVKIPDKLHFMVFEVSKKQNIPIDEIIAAALAQNLFKIIPDKYLEERAKRATGEGFTTILDQVSDIDPEEFDKL